MLRIDPQQTYRRGVRRTETPAGDGDPGATRLTTSTSTREVTPHRSNSITAGQGTSSLPGVGEHFGCRDLLVNLHPICLATDGCLPP